MRWQDRRESTNIEDRRRDEPIKNGLRLPQGKLGIAIIVVVLVAGYYGVDLTPLLNNNPVTSQTQQPPTLSTYQNEELAKFTSVVLATTEDTWTTLFKSMGKTYSPPKLVLYRNATKTDCGIGQAVMGPFYCPLDHQIYIDLSFYEEMKNKFGAGGDFAQGYVIAHEVGHHVQELLGITEEARKIQQGQNKTQQNKISVLVELQADCFAGVWGHYMNNENILDPNDLQEALNAAQAIGDDTLQKRSQGYTVPDSFTHGTSAERYTWFKQGFDSGDIKTCNTFKK